MKFSHFAIGLLSLLSPVSAAWSKEVRIANCGLAASMRNSSLANQFTNRNSPPQLDREIFRIRDEIAAHETDVSATFYDILGIKARASLDDINKAYKLKARSLHPDKVRQTLRAKAAKKDGKGDSGVKKAPSSSQIKKAIKEASERQARLSLIANILRGPARDRYDHFLSNGFPLWKGTDYYYNRYRPGLGTVMFGLFLLVGGGVHYILLYTSWKRQKEFVGRYVRFARNAAWGGNIPGIDVDTTPATPEPQEDEDGMPQAVNRKQRRYMEKEKEKENRKEGLKTLSKKARKNASKNTSKPSSRDASVAPGTRKRVVAENGKVLVVDSYGDVFLEEQDEEGNVNEYLLDPNELHQPTILDTAIVRVPAFFFNSTIGRFLPAKAESEVEFVDEAVEGSPASGSTADEFEFINKSTESLNKAKSSGAQQGKAKKRKGKKN
ncbi:hypothetical protein Golomagni_05419 [Golovinomyces magnicellulatus]|nr:hypothetical protein Golomagni_05419 [Golovinomyces magnicellulatus]